MKAYREASYLNKGVSHASSNQCSRLFLLYKWSNVLPIVNLVGGAYIFRNRNRFFDRDPNVDNDVPAVRKVRVEVVTIPWLVLTTLLVILLIYLWLA